MYNYHLAVKRKLHEENQTRLQTRGLLPFTEEQKAQHIKKRDVLSEWYVVVGKHSCK